MSTQPSNITSTFLRLGSNTRIEKLPVDDTFWLQLIGGKLGDFHHEYLVTTSNFYEDWTSWELHPNGDEVVILLAGKVSFVMETGDGCTTTHLEQTGDFVFVPMGTWHTAKTGTETNLLFITGGEGTQHRPA